MNPTDTCRENRENRGIDSDRPTELIAAREALANALKGVGDADDAAKRAVGEVAAYTGTTGKILPDVRAQLANVLSAPAGEKMHFVRQAQRLLKQEVGDVAPTPASEPPASVTWSDGGERGKLTLDVTRELVEWMELEADESSHGSVEEWAIAQLRTQLMYDLQANHSHTAAVDIDLPEDVAKRVALYCGDLECDGVDVELIDILLSTVDYEQTWMCDGEPWALADMVGENPPRDEEGNDGGV